MGLKPRAAAVRVGCAGWSIPGRHAALFGEGDSVLQRYATRLSAVEINSSFYRSHRPETYRRWADTVPADFRFSVKLPRPATHDLRLQQCGAVLDIFVAEISALGTKLGGVLVQLPPSLVFDARIASTFLAMLRRRTTASVALEPRHASWFAQAATTLLQRHDVARVAADPPPCAGADVPLPSSTWRYWRWHGAPRVYYDAYSPSALRDLATAVEQAPSPRAVAWVVLDNTAHGHAIGNAADLQALLTGATRAGRADA